VGGCDRKKVATQGAFVENHVKESLWSLKIISGFCGLPKIFGDFWFLGIHHMKHNECDKLILQLKGCLIQDDKPFLLSRLCILCQVLGSIQR
jgi:hypothetical protein